jgi:hypothetical protein
MSETDATKIAVLEEKIAGLQKAISLQAAEYERRLTELNHAHAQATTERRQFLQQDVFMTFKDANNNWQREMEVWRSRVIGIGIGSGLAGGGVVQLISGMFQ